MDRLIGRCPAKVPMIELSKAAIPAGLSREVVSTSITSKLIVPISWAIRVRPDGNAYPGHVWCGAC